MTELPRGYWCECWTEDLTSEAEQPSLHASFDAYSAHQADRWVAVALRTITPALDTSACDEAWAWLYEERAETRRALLRSEPCTVTVTGPAKSPVRVIVTGTVTVPACCSVTAEEPTASVIAAGSLLPPLPVESLHAPTTAALINTASHFFRNRFIPAPP